jgi:D-tyrosyl-tRNA(Tyr) deacylase
MVFIFSGIREYIALVIKQPALDRDDLIYVILHAAYFISIFVCICIDSSTELVKLRVFEDEAGKMNRSLLDVGGEVLVISQFTLLADYRKGNRPDFFGAAAPAVANALYEEFIGLLREQVSHVACGEFGADMQVSLCNDGPVTIVMESDVLKKKK